MELPTGDRDERKLVEIDSIDDPPITVIDPSIYLSIHRSIENWKGDQALWKPSWFDARGIS